MNTLLATGIFPTNLSIPANPTTRSEGFRPLVPADSGRSGGAERWTKIVVARATDVVNEISQSERGALPNVVTLDEMLLAASDIDVLDLMNTEVTDLAPLSGLTGLRSVRTPTGLR